MNRLAPPRYLEGRTLLFAIIALGMGGFGIGVTEFAMMGLLQEGAEDLNVTNSQMGLVISTYAIGVVVGAPLLTAVAAKIPKKRAVQLLILLFAVANLSSFFAPDYGTMLFTRFLSGLPHGAYFGLAGVLAGNLVPGSMRGRAIAWVMLGLSVANVGGVPLVTLLGQEVGWRSMFLVVTAVGLLTFALITIFVPLRRAEAGASMRRELSALKSLQVWLAMATGIVGFGGFFAVYSYISPTLTDETGLDIVLVPLALALYGVGMVVGSLIGGRLADWSVFGAIKLASVLMVISMLVFAAVASWVIPTLIMVFVLGSVGSLLIPSLQTLLMDSAPHAQSLAASLNHSALNVANALGAALGAIVISAGLGYRAPSVVGAGLAALGLLIAWITQLRAQKLGLVIGAAAVLERVDAPEQH
ncbi:MFS transporter [Arthrobacter sp. MYb211]|uniref:MFS transporter n=1 Tax=unclassified Arthrobacter TaxID=235627 RepID=UPI000CFCFF3D|nr:MULTISPECIES: MFS transporter [unclassified Arthrobacter]PRA00542.1 MFS transporter [Arthrobacter sp. MYb224]PRA04734.1 MFS transporter [Arthrobacter sp. MYb229]PRA10703.1 MFS transporter [Arthrobacter sp. MYb221]PRB51352.1 MFS transporter [Arthrobacter sp. MYb216]PRC06397.1 MFS transporter [Arthrobacter sp. MYb211]